MIFARPSLARFLRNATGFLSWLVLATALAMPLLAQGAISNVNDGSDTHDKIPGDGTCADIGGKCTLRAAIEEGNNLAGVHTINILVPLVQIGAQGSLQQLRAHYIVNGNHNVVTGS